MLRSVKQKSSLLKNVSTANYRRMINNKPLANIENVMNVPVHFTVKDTARIITLNRPNKLNALNTEMSDSIFNTLNEYAKSSATKLIIFNSSNQPRSFCAGGDVATVAIDNLNQKIKDSIKFFESEYSLNFQIATYDKPIVAIMNGITMGGGVGLAIHAPFRISTENTKWAMPEMDIGFFPDVGTTFALPRILNISNEKLQMAAYLSLTGEVINGEDAYLMGLSSHYISHENLNSLETRLGELLLNEKTGTDSNKENIYKKVNIALEEFSSELPKDYKFKYNNHQLDVIEKVFEIDSKTSIEKILKNLDDIKNPDEIDFAQEIKSKLLTKSIPSLQVAIRLLQHNSKDNISSALKRDLFTAANFCYASKNPDSPIEFTQSVKHKLIEKNKNAYNWKQTAPLDPLQVNSLISPRPSLLTALKRNTENITWNNYPYHSKFQLPSESIINSYIKKVNETNRATDGDISRSITKKEVVNYFTNYSDDFKGKNAVDKIASLICEKNFNVDEFNGLISKSKDL
ncbi:hypothetical protein TPHA_0M01100 [Tetrapisispora phaffii CBS 4417]|uniref:3-hydroxyisobutyryl-CoA hydrolase n=1 Tax=Tetrapisispora phaffii (strain ATCC 24235 / CBS 4417 / NBRC 1672 / NRRL Y-8282 / UCD 70-5) TaxID=1071381 RepID=G8C0H0_TETPH|nr:hypothetical protein TPHA_0M01100 [Tetrapisispora phaffii CBS 4417]CCE65685.1 hypothetical protein TPHA_0M01100 [Tetrapisispora phaffii CBS 4417]